jgi:hypothetical protein
MINALYECLNHINFSTLFGSFLGRRFNIISVSFNYIVINSIDFINFYKKYFSKPILIKKKLNFKKYEDPTTLSNYLLNDCNPEYEINDVYNIQCA